MLRTEQLHGRSAQLPTPAQLPPPPCTLLLFRHLQKTGGISIRHILHRLELSRDWRNYAEGTALHMEGSRRCSPRDEAEEAVRVRLGAPLPPGCNRSFVLPLTLLEELAASCRAAAAAAAATASPPSPPPPPLRAMVELHTRGSYDEVLPLSFLSPEPRTLTAPLIRILTSTLTLTRRFAMRRRSCAQRAGGWSLP